jgi:hypothetical protein
MTLFSKGFDPKDAKPHERHNRALRALTAYKAETGAREWKGTSDDSVLRGMLVDLQLMIVEREAKRMRQYMASNEMPHEPIFTGHPDAVGLDFLMSIGGYDVYRGGETTGSTFIVITGDEGGRYTTTDNLMRMVPGFFDKDR